jgi:hypothetical protein
MYGWNTGSNVNVYNLMNTGSHGVFMTGTLGLSLLTVHSSVCQYDGWSLGLNITLIATGHWDAEVVCPHFWPLREWKLRTHCH